MPLGTTEINPRQQLNLKDAKFSGKITDLATLIFTPILSIHLEFIVTRLSKKNPTRLQLIQMRHNPNAQNN